MAGKLKKNKSLSFRERYLLLEAAAAKMEVRIRLERLTADEETTKPVGGLVRLRGERVVILDKGQPLEARARVLAKALARLVDETTYLPPAVREWLESSGEEE